jgi:hypothetical protein
MNCSAQSEILLVHRGELTLDGGGDLGRRRPSRKALTAGRGVGPAPLLLRPELLWRRPVAGQFIQPLGVVGTIELLVPG